MFLASLARLLALVLLCTLALQLYFLARVALMVVVDPHSTTFERSEAWRLATQEHAQPGTRGKPEKHGIRWRQQWVPYERISDSLKRAVIASEDAGFADHSGVQWDAIERAWERNQAAEARADKANGQRRPPSAAARPAAPAKLVGGSTITQQLAKNLFLGGERSLARKSQEFAITLMLETLLSKRRILEIYLNHVEWGEGVFGAEAAARHYFQLGADKLAPLQAAQLSVMLPAPKRFEKRPASPYVMDRAATVVARMAAVELP